MEALEAPPAAPAAVHPAAKEVLAYLGPGALRLRLRGLGFRVYEG